MVMEVMVAVPKGDQFVEPLIGQSATENPGYSCRSLSLLHASSLICSKRSLAFR